MAIIKCPHCGQDTSDNSGRCSFCGCHLFNGKPDMPLKGDRQYEKKGGVNVGCVVVALMVGVTLAIWLGMFISAVGWKGFFTILGLAIVIGGGALLCYPFSMFWFWHRR